MNNTLMIINLQEGKKSGHSKIPYFKKQMLLFLIVFMAIATSVTAQQTNVTGQVTDPSGETIPGVNILEKNTNNGTVTDLDGNYELTVASPEAILVFSFVGFESQEIVVGGRSTVDVTLTEGAHGLDEVVIIGYGTQRERDLTSAITTVSTDELMRTPTPNPMQSLQGRVAGVQIVSQGAPGASPTVRLRGIGSFEGGAAPLYVVDGMFFDNIDFLNPNDIEPYRC